MVSCNLLFNEGRCGRRQKMAYNTARTKCQGHLGVNYRQFGGQHGPGSHPQQDVNMF